MAIIVEAVQALNDSKGLKKDLEERTAILKKTFLQDKSTRLKIEDELTKILIKEAEEARTLTLIQAQKISDLEEERDVFKHRLENLKEKHRRCKNERNEVVYQLKNEKAQVIKIDRYSFKLKMQLDELRQMQLQELDKLTKDN